MPLKIQNPETRDATIEKYLGGLLQILAEANSQNSQEKFENARDSIREYLKMILQRAVGKIEHEEKKENLNSIESMDVRENREKKLDAKKRNLLETEIVSAFGEIKKIAKLNPETVLARAKIRAVITQIEGSAPEVSDESYLDFLLEK